MRRRTMRTRDGLGRIERKGRADVKNQRLAAERKILEEEEEEEEFITSGNWRGKHNSLLRGAGADQP